MNNGNVEKVDIRLPRGSIRRLPKDSVQPWMTIVQWSSPKPDAESPTPNAGTFAPQPKPKLAIYDYLAAEERRRTSSKRMCGVSTGRYR